eukprot:6178236-Pleurochrysis_carterae.AAC.7
MYIDSDRSSPACGTRKARLVAGPCSGETRLSPGRAGKHRQGGEAGCARCCGSDRPELRRSLAVSEAADACGGARARLRARCARESYVVRSCLALRLFAYCAACARASENAPSDSHRYANPRARARATSMA